MFWREAPALPEGFQTYLDQVAAAIPWRRARPFALRELRTHLLEQKDAFLAQGMTEEAAEAAALRDMGDPAEVGAGLGELHRPRNQRAALAAIGVLALLSVFLRFTLTRGYEFETPDPLRTAAALVLGLGVLVGLTFFDYRILARHAKELYAAALLLGLLTWRFGPQVNGAAWYARHVVLFYPVVYAIWLCACRNKGWKGVFLAVFGGVPLAVVACLAPYITGLFLLLTTGLVLLLAAAGMDWFGIGKRQTAFAACAAALALGLTACWRGWGRVRVYLHPEQDPLGRGYQAMSVRNMLSGAQWQGRTTAVSPYGDYPYEYAVPEWNNDFFLTTIACKLGLLFFFLVVGAMALLFLWLLCRAAGNKNPFGKLLALSALAPLLMQTAAAAVQNLGYVLTAVPVPFFSGNLILIETLALLGLALSTLRQQDLPEEQGTAPRKKWKLVLVSE